MAKSEPKPAAAPAAEPADPRHVDRAAEEARQAAAEAAVAKHNRRELAEASKRLGITIIGPHR